MKDNTIILTNVYLFRYHIICLPRVKTKTRNFWIGHGHGTWDMGHETWGGDVKCEF